MREILFHPHKNLYLKSRPLSEEELRNPSSLPHRELIEELKSVVGSTNALGVSAPQLDEQVRIIVVNVSQVTGNISDEPLVIINPVIKRTPHKPRRSMREGCLSVPGFFERVKRYDWIEYDYISYPSTLPVTSYEANGLMAAVVQHEVDHLDGILFIDRIDAESRSTFDMNWERMMKDMMQGVNSA